MKSSILSVAVAASLGMSSLASAALVYGGSADGGSRFNPGAGAIVYMNCFTAVSAGQTQLQLESVIAGIRRVAVAGAVVDVGVNIYAAEMTFDGVTTYGRGTNYLIYSAASLGGGAASFTQQVNTGTVSGVTLNLELTSNAGLGGFWIGVELTGANAANGNNGWRTALAPTSGASINAFGIFNNAGSGVFQSFFAFGNPAPAVPGPRASCRR